MPSVPLRSQLHVDQLLSNVAVKYSNERFIHDKVAPTVSVKKQSDLYRTYNRNWVVPDTDRAIGGVAREHVFEVGTSNYSLEKHALKSYVPDAAAENYDITSLEADVTIDLTEKLMMRKEIECASHFQTTTSWSLNASLAADELWVTTAAAPIAVFDTATTMVTSQSGVRPNFAIIPLEAYNALKNQSSIVDRIKYTSREYSSNIIAALIGVDEILIPDMYYDTGLYGASATSTAIQPIWASDFAFVGYKPKSAGMMVLSSLYQFNRAKPLVRKWREEEREANAIEVDQEFTFKIVASLTGYYIQNVI